MYRKRLPYTLALLVVLAGCSSVDSSKTPAPAANPNGACNAELVQGMLGRSATAEQVEQARQHAGARSVRVLAPGDAVTLEYNSRRLNIDIDEAEVIQRINCG
ncbi:MAG: I78 family peptidase inhibitor [Pseudomonas sp.]|nr:I78 family peptidase inhibitor [Pseudomonas sp.]